MKYPKENTIVAEIKNEYIEIDNRWMKLHYYTFVFLVIFGFIIEAVLAVLWYQSGSVEISTRTYMLKYIAAPVFVNSLLILADTFVIRSSRIKRKVKVYVISLIYVGACFVLYVVHCIFYNLYLIFTVPILLTVIYSDYLLTAVTAFLSIASKIAADMFIVWDADKTNLLESDFGIINFIISICILFIFYIACVVVIRFEKEKNEAGIQKEIEHYHIQQKLSIDELTEINNRTSLRKAFQDMMEDESGSPYFFAMIDIDNFKALNDTCGHEQGDRCLKEFARILTKNCYQNSTPFRFGGDEFCILFKDESLDSVIKTCKDIQSDLKESPTSLKYMLMTISIGIAKYEKHMSASHLLNNTDSMMYLSKTKKDYISIWGDSENWGY